MHSHRTGFSARILSVLLLACTLAGSCLAQGSLGQWDELVGKRVINRNGAFLGYVHDTVLDLENGRYLGLVVTYGGFFGLGAERKIVPAAAFAGEGPGKTIILDMSRDRFHAAPTMKLSRKVGPPDLRKLAEIYRYYGRQPYFLTGMPAGRNPGAGLSYLGFLQLGSRILLLPVDNLQGQMVGYVVGLRDLQLNTGTFSGVVIRPVNVLNNGEHKYVEPRALRYNSQHTRLRINDHEQPFRESADFAPYLSGYYAEESPERPGNPPPPLAQGYQASDKAITAAIWEAIRADDTLSHYGKTIEVGTIHGKTTLRGRVTTAANRNRILSYATRSAGAGNVTDEITVRPESRREALIDSR